MNGIDVVILILLLLNILRGLKKGLIREVLSFAAVLLGILGGTSFYTLAVPLWKFLHYELAIKVLSFLTVFLLIYLLVTLIGFFMGLILKGIPFIGFFDYLGGALIGFLEIWLIVGGLFYFLNTRGISSPAIKKSKFAPLAQETFQWVFNKTYRGK